MKNLIALSSFALVLALSVTACKKSGDAGEGGTTAKREYITLGTAPTGGAFAPVGAAIVNAVTTGLPALSNRNWVVSTEGTKGTMQNIRQLDAGSLQFGMANSAITYFAERGTEGWDKKYGVQHVMTLAPNVAQFVALEKSNIKSIADFKGKRVVVGPAGAGFNYFIDPILKAHGITTADFDPRNNTYSGAVDMLKNGDADVAFLGGAVPIQAVVSAASTHKIAFVPYDPAAVKTLAEEYEFYAPVTIAADKYSFLKEDFQAISCGQMQLICASALGEDIVYDFTKTLYEQRAEVVKGHPAGRAINPKNAARSVGSTFHPGAIKFYKEIGIGGF